jgi:hypothetical protein
MNSQQAAKHRLRSLGFYSSSLPTSLDDFVKWTETLFDRKLFLLALPMPRGVFGLWCSDAELRHEYILCDSSAPPLHQTHIYLHEISHLLWGHPIRPLTSTGLKDLIRKLRSRTYDFSQSKPHDDEIEIEAEVMAMLIYQEIAQTKQKLEPSIISTNWSAATFLMNVGLA